MKIMDLQFTPLFIPYKKPYYWAQGITKGAELILVTLITDKGIVAFRDPHGIRPLVLGQNKSSYMLASESAALNALGYRFLYDVKPGEAIILDQNGKVSKRQCIKRNTHSPCLFEFV